MKKISLIISFLCAAFITQAQSYNAKIGTDTTFAVAGTKTFSVTISGVRSSVTFQTNITKVSGTVAGTIVVQGSADNGAHYATLASHTLADATAVWQDAFNYNPDGKYRVVVTTTGTNSVTASVWCLYR